MHQVYGIRHHGPGSARALLQALEQGGHDAVIIEAPADAAPLLRHLGNKGLQPPVAMLIYNQQQVADAVYYPLAVFSPEWQAMQFAHRQNMPVYLMDWPVSAYLGWRQQEKQQRSKLQFEEQTFPYPAAVRKDPLGYLAQLAGYEDRERWWEATFEHLDHSSEVFEAIAQMMQALRMDTGNRSEPEDLLREAHMRTTIRQAFSNGCKKPAVVCGAWHVPALQNLSITSAKHDKDLFKGLPKVKTSPAWIPWSYERLSTESGYAAGIVSPAWYELLFEHPGHAVSYWMTTAAREMRNQDLQAVSAAHAIDAGRLAETLARFRGLRLPGIPELQEAFIATLGAGQSEQWNWLREHLVIGRRIGVVPPNVAALPIQNDLEQCIKTARLSKEYNSREKVEKVLDLRKPNQLLASQLLYRLLLLEIHWGKKLPGSDNALGTFNEHWLLQWQPEMSLRIIAAGMWGNTVQDAAIYKVLQDCDSISELPSFTRLLQGALFAGLPAVLSKLTSRLQMLSAATKDTSLLLQALPVLIHTYRYGSVRESGGNTFLTPIITEMIARVSINLPNAVIGIDDDSAGIWVTDIISGHHAIQQWDDRGVQKGWLFALEQVMQKSGVHPRPAGLAARMLLDKERINLPTAGQNMHRAISRGAPAAEGARWLEGFFYGSGLLLIHHPDLWHLVDTWIKELEDTTFQTALPILRRTFSKFQPGERRKILERAQKGTVGAVEEEKQQSSERHQKVQSVLDLIFGN